jgi:hypothetical protein
MNTFFCEGCNIEKTNHKTHVTGYGEVYGQKFCYACCGEMDKRDIETADKFTLYLVKKNGKQFVSNWPGTLSYPVHHSSKGKHNIAVVRYDVWFTDHLGRNWHGVQYGDWTQICHCKRIKG